MSVPILDLNPEDVSFSPQNSLHQSFSHDPIMVINDNVGQGKKQLVFYLPDFFQSSCTSEKATCNKIAHFLAFISIKGKLIVRRYQSVSICHVTLQRIAQYYQWGCCTQKYSLLTALVCCNVLMLISKHQSTLLLKTTTILFGRS